MLVYRVKWDVLVIRHSLCISLHIVMRYEEERLSSVERIRGLPWTRLSKFTATIDVLPNITSSTKDVAQISLSSPITARGLA